jgi:hypothetical protein
MATESILAWCTARGIDHKIDAIAMQEAQTLASGIFHAHN